jgi:hypothetical protein
MTRPMLANSLDRDHRGRNSRLPRAALDTITAARKQRHADRGPVGR